MANPSMIQFVNEWSRRAPARHGQPGADPVLFLSYQTADTREVLRVERILKQALWAVQDTTSGASYRVEHFAHPEAGTPLGSEIPEQISRWLWRCRGAVIFLSTDYVGSPWCYEMELPALVWRQRHQGMPLFFFRLNTTPQSTDRIRIPAPDGRPEDLDLGLIAHDRNPRVNLRVSPGAANAWLGDLSNTDFAARVVAMGEEIAQQLASHAYNRAAASSGDGASVQAPGAAPSGPPLTLTARPLLRWTGDFSTSDSSHAAARRLFGREAELQHLSDLGNDPEVAIVAVTALGGQGKTTVAQAWVEQRMSEAGEHAFEGLFAFSFNRGRTQEEFAREWEDFVAELAPAASRRERRELLRKRRLLIFIDGLEDVLTDTDAAATTGRLPRGPVLETLVDLCADRECLSVAVVTSRVQLEGFEDIDGRRLEYLALHGLAPVAGAQLLHDLGVTGVPEARRQHYSRDLSGHPLMLRVFADATNRRALTLDFGDAADAVAAAMGLTAPLDLKDRLESVIAYYRNYVVNARERMILEAIAVFRGAATIDRIRMQLRLCHGIQTNTFAAVSALIERLATAGIVSYRDEGSTRIYGCHPVLRDGFRPDEAASRAAALIVLYQKPVPLRPHTLPEASPYLEAMHIYLDAQELREAHDLLRPLAWGDTLLNLRDGARPLLDCLLRLLDAPGEDRFRQTFGLPALSALLPRLVGAAISLDEWEIADRYARHDADLLAEERGTGPAGDALSLSQRASIAAEIGSSEDARLLYDQALGSSQESSRGLILLERAELERQLGVPRAALAFLEQWTRLAQPTAIWFSGWGEVLRILTRLVRRTDPALAARFHAASLAWRNQLAEPPPDNDESTEYETLDLSLEAERRPQTWARLLALATSLDDKAGRRGSKNHGSWPVGKAQALNGLGRAGEAELELRRWLPQLHPRSWRRLWGRTAMAQVHILGGKAGTGQREAQAVMREAQLRQRLLIVRDVAEMLVRHADACPDRVAVDTARGELDVLQKRLTLGAADLPEFGPLPGEPGWDDRVLAHLGTTLPEAGAAHAELLLRRAVECGLETAVETCLRNGANPAHAPDAQGSALETAIRDNRAHLVPRLLAAAPRPLAGEVLDASARAAILADHPAILQQLLDAADPEDDLSLTALLHFAAANGAGGETVRLLLAAGADVTAHSNGLHPLVSAARHGNLCALAAMAEAEPGINACKDADGETALMAAMGRGKLPVIAWLMDQNVAVDARDSQGNTAVEYALRSDQVRALDLFGALTGRAPLDAMAPQTLALIAAMGGRMNLLQRALERGAQPQIPDDFGRVPLVEAARGGHADFVTRLFATHPGLDVETRDAAGCTALLAAVAEGHREMVGQLLAEHGAKPDALDSSGRGLLELALEGGRLDMLQWLTTRGLRMADRPAAHAALRAAALAGRGAALAACLAATPPEIARALCTSLGINPLPPPAAPDAIATWLLLALRDRPAPAPLRLPERSPQTLDEAGLQALPGVLMACGAASFAGHPLRALTPEVRQQVDIALLASPIANLEAFDLAAARVADLPWLGAWLLTLPHQDRSFEVPLVLDHDGLHQVPGQNHWIYQAVEGRSLPDSAEGLMAYVRFFLATVVSATHGRFLIVENAAGIEWPSGADPQMQMDFAARVTPLEFAGTRPDGRHAFRGTLLFRQALFATTVLVDADWQLELTDEVLLLEDLPILASPACSYMVRC